MERWPELGRDGLIYGLHTGDFQYRYIGMTVNTLAYRFRQHKTNAKAGKRYPVYDWMRKYGDQVEATIIHQSIPSSNLHKLEQSVIYCFRFAGFKLLNLTDGGPGTLGRVHSEETRKLISEKAKGRIVANKGIPMGKDQRDALIGRTVKISQDQAQEIHARKIDGEKTSKLAQEYGISNSYVNWLARGRGRVR